MKNQDANSLLYIYIYEYSYFRIETYLQEMIYRYIHNIYGPEGGLVMCGMFEGCF